MKDFHFIFPPFQSIIVILVEQQKYILNAIIYASLAWAMQSVFLGGGKSGSPSEYE